MKKSVLNKDLKAELKPFTMDEIQVCPICGKVDVYKDDGHSCIENLANKGEFIGRSKIR